ncbi:MAG: ABC transporter permease [Bacteroidaceae bacterium]|nr:ABC transporter permease [Bacteroidaceae bacterium]
MMNIRGQHNGTKIFCLAVGLTVGLVLLAKVRLERNYDRSIVDREHTYEVQESFQKQGQEAQEYGATPGGAVPAMCRYIPEIVVGTRYTMQFEDEKLVLEDGGRMAFGQSAFADSCFFDVFGSQVLVGNEKEILATPGQCLISERLNERLGGDMVGRTFCYVAAPGRPMTVGGVFRDYDENSRFARLDIVMSMPSIGTYSYDGTSNLMGNDRYHSYVRLRPDADMKKIREEMNVMLREQIPWEEVHAAGIDDFRFTLHPVMEGRENNKTVRTTCTILSVVAVVMLFTAVMNYILVVISLLVGRARLVALRKVLGAPRWEFYLTTLGEAAIHVVLALVVMGLLLWLGQDWIRDLMGVGIGTLFSVQTWWVIVAVCLLVLIACGLLPGYIYSRIPLRYAYRLFSESKRVWKLSLLAFQLTLSTMLLVLLGTIYRQYDYMLNKDLGYDYKDVAYVEIPHQSDSIYHLARELERLPCVASAATAYSLFFERQSGNNVMLPGDKRQFFNYACLYFDEASIIPTMGLQLVQGRGPKQVEHPGWDPEAVVDEAFAKKLREFTGWQDVVGQSIVTTEFGENMPLTIVGVVRDFTVGTVVARDERPAMMINGNIYASNILVKLNGMTPENLTAVQQVCDRFYPDDELVVKRYADELTDSYRETQHTRSLLLIGCLASLFITLIGLVGYVRDEVQRRSRELAIRKVLGAAVRELQALFLRSLAFIALPSVVVGTVAGWFFSTMLLQQFPDAVALHGYLFFVDALLVLAVVALVVFLQTRRIALANPIDYLKTE